MSSGNTIATLAISDALGWEWDVVIVGAGPAGAFAAHAMARRGLWVLLVDKAAFPRYKVCGACLNPRALAVLNGAGLGVLAERCGAEPIKAFHAAIRGRDLTLPVPGGVALSREAFDAALIQAAIAAGAQFLPGTVACLGEGTESGAAAGLRQGSQCGAVSSRLVLCADGLGSRLIRAAVKDVPRVAQDSRVGAGVIVAAAPAFYESGVIFMACGARGYVGLVRVEDGRLNMAAAFDRGFVRSLGGAGAAAAAILNEVGWPPIPPLAETAWRGTARLTVRAPCIARERVFVLGDAAGYVEPFTGEGIAWALASAEAVVPLALRAVQCWDPALIADWECSYRRVIGRRVLCHAAAGILRRPGLTRAAFSILARIPGLAAPLLKALNHRPAMGASRLSYHG
ncbi:MAG: NAD(P)/FAD-dependent oxidoreductase [Burkholderiales bacterium]